MQLLVSYYSFNHEVLVSTNIVKEELGDKWEQEFYVNMQADDAIHHFFYQQKKGAPGFPGTLPFFDSYSGEGNYIIPPIPPIPAAGMAGAGFSSFLSAITHSVVKNIPAIEAAFSRATRVTLAGSITPAAKKFS